MPFRNKRHFYFVSANSNSIKLLLRRSIQVSLRYSTIAWQFTPSKAKGHTLHRPFICSTISRGVRSVNLEPNRIVVVQVCDATNVDQGTNAGIIITLVNFQLYTQKPQITDSLYL
jgi:hypothetical protein